MKDSLGRALVSNFLGHAPSWYKLTILGFLVLNPIVTIVAGPFVAGWFLVAEFIFTLAMALKCYPLQPGGLLAIEAVVIGLTSAEAVYRETEHNFPVILLLIFIVAGIWFLRDMLLFVFGRILLGVRSKRLLSVLFCGCAAFLSAFLDALTVTAMVIAVAHGFYRIYHRVESGQHDSTNDGWMDVGSVPELQRRDLDQFRAFLRSLVMHAAVGTALGGVCTIVGEPQNLIIGKVAGWQFVEFFVRMAPVTLPVLVAGLVTCLLLEITGWFGYGAELSPAVRQVLTEFQRQTDQSRSLRERCALVMQGLTVCVLMVALGLHLAEVGLIGLLIIVLATAMNGVVEEERLGHAFEAALPFTALLVVFFAIVAVIQDQALFSPLSNWILTLEGHLQVIMYFLAAGGLSVVSDNVFVGTVYITEVQNALMAARITREQFDLLAIAINTGTNIPSVATPNGQAAFLFLLTSALAPVIRLSYGGMVWMALPYAIVMTTTALLAVAFLL
ncbi:MAG: sodium/proton antiporter NhaB [Gammaproteobacteria bacterium]|nr:sodium/proton antiporter NhaB [Gammaproteobacteria bacterium]